MKLIRDALKESVCDFTTVEEVALILACGKLGVTTIDDLADKGKITGTKLREASEHSTERVVSLASDLLGEFDRDASHILMH